MDSSSQKCPICYETIQNKNFIVTNCNHTFCSNCILRLNRSSNSCPLCRADLTNIPIAENLDNPEENILYTNQFYRRILQESENSINSLEVSLESYRYIVQNLISMIRMLGIDNQINGSDDDQSTEELLDDYNSEQDEVLEDEDNNLEPIPNNNFLTESEFDSLYNRFNENKAEALDKLLISPVWDYLNNEERNRIYNQISKDWEDAKIICIFPDVYTSYTRLNMKLQQMETSVLRIIIKHFKGRYLECFEKNECIQEIFKILPRQIDSINV